ncbi:MAG: Preprotein translocase, SecG subunit [Candidatus Pacebacteria bacterium GW2011_GWF2_38_9]|nr:MAG: preprotein translocase subunit SecG, preprotein translocase subunit SecG [candidate division TM6 bacterium GW2011_GWF2_28_16]KKQ07792.1 MAG: Preprotein translocase, SecG subunit [Candidatus Pacebacteria bacterium GW2011_GWF1_36_5]KKQ88644.1 MAG: Preprotein translocase, SecG subunit [Candidatus Pacebacteria bacterium GW2011_GWF2_38_9]HAZ73708.1 preprotein translocase subunit SecG [Candidatus Paceibacterota bacterium]
MNSFLLASQLFVSIILASLVLLQPGSSGGGSLFSGSGETYHTRKGVEKLLYYITIFFLVLFVANSIALLLI